MSLTNLTKLISILTWTLLLNTECFSYILNSKKCANKPMVNGAGYAPHHTDCDKFIQCQYNKDGVVVGQERQCAFSTYWNDDKLTCTPATETYCPKDKCHGQINEMRYPSQGNCRGYWSCMDDRSLAKCCPLGQYYNTTFGCVDNDDDHKCFDMCFNDIDVLEPEVDSESEPEAPPCDKRPVVGNRYEYEIKAAGLITVIMKCPIGTVYNSEKCDCIHDENRNSATNKCTRELYLTFDTDVRDKSGKNNHVFNENVEIENGVAKFNGINSRLIIPRFSNMDTIESLFIRIKYFSRHRKSGHARAIVSNSDCLNVPSILLAEDDINTYYGVGTTETNFMYTHIPQHNTSNSLIEKNLVYNFSQGKLKGSDGYSVKVEEALGFIRNTHCALHVGYAESFEPFEGEIDELEVFLCDPYSHL